VGNVVTRALQTLLVVCAALLLTHSAALHPEWIAPSCWQWCPQSHLVS